jgi:prepilin signal peptidase PulO-like enzyme (type II secretory pathway)
MAQIELTILRLLMTATMLAFAGYKDFKYREVSDWVWIIFVALALPLDAYELWMGTLSITSLALAIGFSAVLAIGGWYFSLFGEADLLAFLAISVISPTMPNLEMKPLLISPIFFPLSLISNTVLLAASSIFIVISLNIKGKREWFKGYEDLSGIVKLGLLLTARRKEIDSMKGPPFEYPLETVNEDGFIHVNLWPDISDDSKATETLRKLREKGRKRVWVTYTHPFLFILLLGYMTTILLGDISLWIVSKFIY